MLGCSFGIPERINSYQLKQTVKSTTSEEEEGEPYRLFNLDHFNDKYPYHSLYGTIPIILSKNPDSPEVSGVFWCNASDTFVDIIETAHK